MKSIHWGSLLAGVAIGMFGIPFVQQVLAKAKTKG